MNNLQKVKKIDTLIVVAPGGSIIHIGLTQPAGTFNFRKKSYCRKLAILQMGLSCGKWTCLA